MIAECSQKARVLRIIEINLKKGFAKAIPETLDDLWHLYNVIYEDDKVYARTKREMKTDQEYARPRRGERVSVFLGVRVEKVEWDKLLGRLRVHGRICEAPDKVPTGPHHTISIGLNKPLTIVKKKWAHHHVDRLKRAGETSERPIIIISIDDEGYAIATTKQYGIDVNMEEKTKLPGKLEAEKRSTAMKEYLHNALQSLRQVWTQLRSPIAIIGVGFVKSDFDKLVEKEDREIAESVVDVRSVNNGGVAGIQEALRSGVLLKTMKHTRIAEEAEIVEEILRRLGKKRYDVSYGIEEVKSAAALGAIETTVLADTILRKSSDEERRNVERLMKTAEEKGGKVMIISTEHEAGEKLLALGGIAALLRYPLR